MIPTSIISRINNNEENVIVDDYFKVVLINLLKFLKNRGNFDITVGPLVNSWGFGPTTKNLRKPK
jgi:thiamine biosynthesis lipoprotein